MPPREEQERWRWTDEDQRGLISAVVHYRDSRKKIVARNAKKSDDYFQFMRNARPMLDWLKELEYKTRHHFPASREQELREALAEIAEYVPRWAKEAEPDRQGTGWDSGNEPFKAGYWTASEVLQGKARAALSDSGGEHE